MATPKRSPAAVEDEVQEPEIPVSQLPASQVGHPDEPQSYEEDPEISTTSSVLGLKGREIEVEPIVAPRQDPKNPFMVIRMNETLEDFTYGNQTAGVKLVEGRQYRVPKHIGQYLDGLGYVYH